MIFKTKNFSAKEIDRFRELQTLVFSLQTEIADILEKGMSERDVTTIMMKKYRAAGAGNYFHLPVALFGERTALPGDWSIGHFFPKKKLLAKGDSVILDAAPLFGGYLVDTSYSFCFGKNKKHDAMMRDIIKERALILDAVNAGQSFQKIALDVRARASANGYESAHEKHPGEVLGHRAGRWRFAGKSQKNKGWRMKGFDGATLSWYITKSKIAKLGLKTQNPLWGPNEVSNHKPTDGLWLVEPHYGKDGVGAKWEEILIIKKGKAEWLQDNPPHVAQWAG